MITIDNIAYRYGLLPSEVLSRASTFDLAVIDASAKWENYRHERANKTNKGVPVAADLSQEQMMAMIRQVKEAKSND